MLQFRGISFACSTAISGNYRRQNGSTDKHSLSSCAKCKKSISFNYWIGKGHYIPRTKTPQNSATSSSCNLQRVQNMSNITLYTRDQTSRQSDQHSSFVFGKSWVRFVVRNLSFWPRFP